MRKKYPRLALFGALALALGAIAGTGSAQAAKVTATAAGGALADAPATTPAGVSANSAPLTQTFNLSGADVTKMQVKDVNVILNSTGSAGGANGDIRAKLIAPSGDNFGSFISGLFQGPGGVGKSLMNLKLDDQSDLLLCDPLFFAASDCNYLTGSTPGAPPAGDGGTATGSVGTGAGFLNQFRGLSPEGAWRLIWWDTANDMVTHTIGTATLEVTTGKRFAKEGKKKKKKKKKKK